MTLSRRSLGVVLASATAACAVSTRPPGGLAEQRNLSTMGAELRIRVRGLMSPFLGAVEQAADAARARCGVDPAVAAAALSWKLGAIPQVQDALLQPDPAVAFADGWAYAMQLRDFLGGERGRAALGACHVEAAARMGQVVGRGRAQAEVLAPGDAARIEARIRTWARDHPLRSLELPRPSLAGELAAGVARSDLGPLAAVGTVVETLDDLVFRIAAYRESLTKEARWIGELAAVQVQGSEATARALRTLDRVGLAVDRLGALAAGVPALVARERTATLAALRGEREEALAEVDRQRAETLRVLQGERAAVLAEAQSIGQAAIDQAADRAERLVDRTLARAALLGGLLLLMLAVGAGAVAWGVVHSAGWRERRSRPA